jgi:hypothetical protein
MNEKVNVDLKSFDYIFARNKPYLVSVIVIIISVILFFQFVIPQFKSLLAARKEAQDSMLKIEVLKKNLNLLSNINDKNLDLQVNTVKLALPLDKDFIGVLNSIYFASQKTGVSLGSFLIAVGDISGSGDNINAPDIKISIPINGGIVEVNNFVRTISRLAPLSEVYSIRVGAISSEVNLSFYYKTLRPSGYSPDNPLNPVSQMGLDLINELNGFENISPIPQSTQEATSPLEELSPDEDLE